MIAAMMEMAEKRLTRMNRRRREPCPASDLVVGVQCGGSDAFSGVTANPAVGYAADLIVRAGGTVMFSEVTEVRDAIHLLTPRAIDESVGRALLREMAWYDRYLESGGADRSANPAPGNKKGGLANVVEKALGSIVKSGSSRIVDVLGPGERVRRKGLIFAATPASDFVCGTLQLAAGMTLQVFTTGRGTPYGLPMVPVVKVSTNTPLARPMGRPHRSRRRTHSDRRGEHRRCRLGAVPSDSRRRERKKAGRRRPVRASQLPGPVQPGSGDVMGRGAPRLRVERGR